MLSKIRGIASRLLTASCYLGKYLPLVPLSIAITLSNASIECTERSADAEARCVTTSDFMCMLSTHDDCYQADNSLATIQFRATASHGQECRCRTRQAGRNRSRLGWWGTGGRSRRQTKRAFGFPLYGMLHDKPERLHYAKSCEGAPFEHYGRLQSQEAIRHASATLTFVRLQMAQ
jgi:hypothetical protein